MVTKNPNANCTMPKQNFKGILGFLPILESLSRSKPCICGSNGAIGEVSKGGGCINLFNQESVEELSSAMEELLLNPEKLKQLKLEADGRNYGTWKAYANNVMNFFFSQVHA